MNYTLIYNIDPVKNCGVIQFNNNQVIMDFDDLFSIINFEKKFMYYDDTCIYPYYLRHNQKISYLEYMFKYNNTNIKYIFKNGDQFDLRRLNITLYHEYHEHIINNYKVINYSLGHYTKNGIDAYIIKNPLWYIQENDVDYILMYCEKDTIIKLCQKSLDQIIEYETTHNDGKKITFFKHSGGYVSSTSTNESSLYIHQIITGCYGNGKGTKNISVDHIDQNPLNNTLDNLRIATREEQEQNSKGIKPDTKRERKYNAKDLPEGITHNMMKKYVVYYQEWLDKDHTCQREYFKIEQHPKLDKIWIGTKSNKVSIQEKLLQVNKVVVDLECDIYPEKQKIGLPKYISLVTIREKPHLVYDQKTNDVRMCIKMVLPEEYDLHSQLEILNDKIKEKYKDHVITM